ncbi:MAG TPA: hypothetical protein VNX29_17855 [Kaistia sp.]|nr:hypothetical protein [Kaistia sp.]
MGHFSMEKSVPTGSTLNGNQHRHCSKHKSAYRRHGDPVQRGVTKAELAEYRELVSRRMQQNPDSPVWPGCEANWLAMADHAHAVLEGFLSGRPGFRHERIAAQETARLAIAVEASKVAETILAMFIMLELQPSRFRSDRAFRAQMVRRVRGLTDLNVGRWADSKSGRTKLAYSELPPKATAVMGLWLAKAIGGVGVHLGRMERSQLEQDQQRRETLRAALAELH